MSRIVTNIQSLVSQRVLLQNNRDLNTSMTRLSTGLKINSGKDDPAGLIASEALRAEKKALSASIENIGRANNVIATAEGGLMEINKLLLELETLVDKSANKTGISDTERNANQLQIDSILQSIDRFANTTEFQGKRLLAGELDYDVSAVATSALARVQINGAKIPNDSFRDVEITVTGSAQLAQLNYTASAVTGGTVSVEIAGNKGTEVITFTSGTTVSEMATAITAAKEVTGVSAVASAGSGLQLFSTAFGSSQFVTVGVIEDDGSNFATALQNGDGGDGKDFGRDATVMINGNSAVADGLRASMRSSVLSLDVDLTRDFGTLADPANPSTTFSVLGGGADFMISPTVNLAGVAALGIPSVTTSNLGSTNTGFLSSLATGKVNALNSGNYQQAQEIVREAQQQVSFLRGRLGGFQKNTLETTESSLRVTLENVSAAESSIRETDFAEETSKLTRSQILVQAATRSLQLANNNPQNVLSLLG
jgi:flagellin